VIKTTLYPQIHMCTLSKCIRPAVRAKSSSTVKTKSSSIAVYKVSCGMEAEQRRVVDLVVVVAGVPVACSKYINTSFIMETLSWSLNANTYARHCHATGPKNPRPAACHAQANYRPRNCSSTKYKHLCSVDIVDSGYGLCARGRGSTGPLRGQHLFTRHSPLSCSRQQRAADSD